MKVYKIFSILCVVVSFAFLLFSDNGEKDKLKKNANDLVYVLENAKEYTDNKELPEEKKKTNEEKGEGGDEPAYFTGQLAENETIINYSLEDKDLNGEVLVELEGEKTKKKYTFHLDELGDYKDLATCEKDIYNVKCSVNSDDEEEYDITFDKKIDVSDSNTRHTFNIGVKSKGAQEKEVTKEDEDTFYGVKQEIKKTWFTLVLLLAVFIIYVVINKKNRIGGNE